jgi:hypothetical protein
VRHAILFFEQKMRRSCLNRFRGKHC